MALLVRGRDRTRPGAVPSGDADPIPAPGNKEPSSGPQRANRPVFQSFLEHAPFVGFIKDREGRYLWANPAWLNYNRYEGKMDPGPTDEDLWPAETAARFRSGDDLARSSGRPIELVEVSEGRDGKLDHWLTIKFALEDGQVAGLALEVTERIATDLALKESEARYQSLIEAIPTPLLVVDHDRGSILAVNEAACRDYGRSRSDLMGSSLADLESHDSPMIEIKATPTDPTRPTTWPARHRTRDGRVLDVEITSRSIRYQGRDALLMLAQDVTDRLRAEDAHRVSLDRLNLILDAVNLGLWYIDLPFQETILNERGRQLFELGPDDPVTPSVMAMIHPEDMEGFTRAFNAVMTEGKPFDHEYRIQTRSGEIRWIRGIGQLFDASRVGPSRFDGVLLDVTHHKRNERMLRESKEEADRANQAKDRILAMLGHELRTPLTPILAAVDALLDDPAAHEPGGSGWPRELVRETLGMIRRNIGLETRLIGDLLDLSRIDRGRLRLALEEVDLATAIRDGIAVCRDETYIRGLEIHFDFQAEATWVRADHARMLQVVWNLVHNAAKFSRLGSVLTIRTRNTPTGRLRVEFRDNGRGIDPASLPRIFESFEQAQVEDQGRLGGLGLGLAISRSIAEAHGGTLTAESPGTGRGSTFILDLPSIETRAGGLGTGRPESSPGGESPRILLAEDNADTLRYLQLILGHRGYRVEGVMRVADALAMARVTDFDLLISDIELGDGTGLELMRSLRGKLAGIAISGFGSTSDVELSLEAGFSAHLVKPIEVARLDDAIRTVLAQRPVSPE